MDSGNCHAQGKNSYKGDVNCVIKFLSVVKRREMSLLYNAIMRQDRQALAVSALDSIALAGFRLGSGGILPPLQALSKIRKWLSRSSKVKVKLRPRSR